MKSSLTGSLAVVALASQAFAGGETNSEWLGLDQELHALSSNISLQDNEGPEFGVLLRSSLVSSDDFTTGTEDTLGFALNDARLWGQGSLGDFTWRMSANALARTSVLESLNSGSFSGTASDLDLGLEDAYASLALNENLDLTMGRFIPPSFQSGTWGNQDGLLFVNRTNLGAFGYQWQEGVSLSGNYDDGLSWVIAAMNGLDGTADELDLRGRIEYATGEQVGNHEGGLGYGDDLSAVIGLTYADEGAADDGTWFGLDVTARVAGFSFHAEVADFDDDWAGALGTFFGGLSYTDGGPSPYSATVGYCIPDTDFELAVRYEDLDDDAETTLLTFGANMYMEGHNGKWQLNFLDVSSDDAGVEGSAILLGLTVGSDS
jgi:hypothetical protein